MEMQHITLFGSNNSSENVEDSKQNNETNHEEISNFSRCKHILLFQLATAAIFTVFGAKIGCILGFIYSEGTIAGAETGLAFGSTIGCGTGSITATILSCLGMDDESTLIDMINSNRYLYPQLPYIFNTNFDIFGFESEPEPTHQLMELKN